MRTPCFALAHKIVAALGFAIALMTVPAIAEREKYASIVVDLRTDRVLHARYADDDRYPASLTKAMTLYMLFDELKRGSIRLNDTMPVSSYAAGQPPSALGLKPGATITVKDAIHALVTKSANDVAAVVAERLGGSESRFATLMTVKARAMGMKNTRFMNASGLPDPYQVSTARDMAVLAKRLLSDHPEYYGYFANAKFSWRNRVYNTHNRLIGKVDGVDGIKTGYTRASGFNLMTSAKRGGHRVIVIVFGGLSAQSRDRHVADLVEAAYRRLAIDARSKSLRHTFTAAQPSNPASATGKSAANNRPAGEKQKVHAEGDAASEAAD